VRGREERDEVRGEKRGQAWGEGGGGESDRVGRAGERGRGWGEVELPLKGGAYYTSKRDLLTRKRDLL
jgi:hypothetical protein